MMAERVVSVKMPSSLVKELRHLTAEHHYLDLSEQLRSVVRQKCLDHTRGQELERLRHDIEQQVSVSNTQMRKEQLLGELSRLLHEVGK